MRHTCKPVVLKFCIFRLRFWMHKQRDNSKISILFLPKVETISSKRSEQSKMLLGSLLIKRSNLNISTQAARNFLQTFTAYQEIPKYSMVFTNGYMKLSAFHNQPTVVMGLLPTLSYRRMRKKKSDDVLGQQSLF